MWSLRVLNGPQAGRILSLSLGQNTVGRSTQAQVVLKSQGVSKKHAVLIVSEQSVQLQDLGSSNGTYLNGSRVQNAHLQLGDKVAFHDVICDLVSVSANAQRFPQTQHSEWSTPPPARWNEAPTFEPPQYEASQSPPNSQAKSSSPDGILDRVHQYLDEVVLPGIYKLPEAVDYRIVILSFLTALIVLTAGLSVIPMLHMTQTAVSKEAKRRTLSLARSLAKQNEQALAQGLESALSTSSIKLEDGVVDALIIKQSDGTIIAPADRAGQSHQYGFTIEAVRQSRETLRQFEGTKIGAAVPMQFYTPEIGSFSIKYYAVVVYDSDVLAVDVNQSAGLFIQTLFIALVFGALIGFFLIRLIERPYQLLTEQIDSALREGRDLIEVPFQFPALKNLVDNLIPLLTRAVYGSPDEQSGAKKNILLEAENLMQLIALPAFTFHPEGYLISVNMGFEELINRSQAQLQNQPLTALADQALQLNLIDLIERSTSFPTDVQTSEIDFSAEHYHIACQAILTDDSQVGYYLLTLTPMYAQEESAS